MLCLGSRFSHILFLLPRIFIFLPRLLNILRTYPEISAGASPLLEAFPGPHPVRLGRVTPQHALIKLLYQSTVAAVMNYHKLDGLRQLKFFFSQCWRLKVQNQSIGMADLPPEALGENVSLPLPASGVQQHSLAYGCISVPQSHAIAPVCPSSPLL